MKRILIANMFCIISCLVHYFLIAYLKPKQILFKFIRKTIQIILNKMNRFIEKIYLFILYLDSN